MGTRVIFEGGRFTATPINGPRATLRSSDANIRLIKAQVPPWGGSVTWSPATTLGWHTLEPRSFYCCIYVPRDTIDIDLYLYADQHGNIFTFQNREALEEAAIANAQGTMYWVNHLPRLGANSRGKKKGRPAEPPAPPPPPRTRFDRINKDIVDEPKPPKKAATMSDIDEALAAAGAPEPEKPSNSVDDVVTAFLKTLK